MSNRVCWKDWLLYIELHMHKLSTKKMAAHISSELGFEVKPWNLYQAMIAHGLCYNAVAGYITAGEAARLLEVAYSEVAGVIRTWRRQGRRFHSNGRHLYLSLEQFEALEAYFQPIPKGYISTADAGHRLGYAGHHRIAQLAKQGKIPALYLRNRWWVSESTLAQMESVYKATGGIRVQSWERLKIG